MTRRNPTPDAGFTLLELLVVLAIVGMVGVLTMPTLAPPSDALRLQAAAGEIIQTFRRARSSAIARNTDVAVTIDVDKHTVHWPAGQLLRVDRDITAQLKVAEPEPSAPARGSFRFFADGSSTGGNVTLKLKHKETHICVDWLSGRAQPREQC